MRERFTFSISPHRASGRSRQYDPIVILATIILLLGILGFLFLFWASTSWGQSSQPHPMGTFHPATPSPTTHPITPTLWPIQTGVVIDLLPTPSPTSVATATPTSAPPDQVLLEKVPIGKQTRPLNCEFQSASDLLWYYGLPYAWDEIFALVGYDAGGNPHRGFVGYSFDDPPGQLYPNGYGVYAEPLARGLAKIGVHAEVHYNESADWLKAQLQQGHPVMIWATANMMPRQPEYWTAADGQRIKAVRGEHTYLVIGYDPRGVWVADPWDGRRHHYPWQTFLESWSILDRMALVIRDIVTPTPIPTP